MSDIILLLPKVYGNFFQDCQEVKQICSRESIEEKYVLKIYILATKIFAAISLVPSVYFAFVALKGPLLASFMALACAGFLLALSIDLVRISINIYKIDWIFFNDDRNANFVYLEIRNYLFPEPRYQAVFRWKFFQSHVFENTYFPTVYQRFFFRESFE